MNKWEAHLLAMADAQASKGENRLVGALRAWGRGLGAIRVAGPEEFYAALRMIGFSPNEIATQRDIVEASADKEDRVIAIAPRNAFWMVYREGGRSPVFKHPDVVSASKEAARVARESGETTHVLGVVETHVAHTRPTPKELADHATAHPFGYTGPVWGLWRVVRSGELPRIVPIRSEMVATPYVAYDSDWLPGANIDTMPDDLKWFPLDATGKDVTIDEIPF